jgi:hypothetical protein
VEAPWLLASEVTYPQWICRMDLVWSKPNGLPESVTDRVRASHEYWFHLTREPRYFAAVDEVREPYSVATISRNDYARKTPEKLIAAGNAVNQGPLRTERNGHTENPLGSLPGSVWTIPSEPLRVPDHLPQHFAAFPSEWPKRLILGWSPSGICTRCGEGRRPVVEKEREGVRVRPVAATQIRGGGSGGGFVLPGADTWNTTSATIIGYACACPELCEECGGSGGTWDMGCPHPCPGCDGTGKAPDAPTRPAVVLDPFCGTGTTVAVAHHLGRHGIGTDLSADYLRLAEWRCTEDWNLRQKVTGSKPVTTDPAQLDLFSA